MTNSKFKNSLGGLIYNYLTARDDNEFVLEIKKHLNLKYVQQNKFGIEGFEFIYAFSNIRGITTIYIYNNRLTIEYSHDDLFFLLRFSYGDNQESCYYNYEQKGIEELLKDVMQFINLIANEDISLEFMLMSDADFNEALNELSHEELSNLLKKYTKIVELPDNERQHYYKIFRFMEEFDNERVLGDSIRESYIRHLKNGNIKKMRLYNNKTDYTILSKDWNVEYRKEEKYRNCILELKQ